MAVVHGREELLHLRRWRLEGGRLAGALVDRHGAGVTGLVSGRHRLVVRRTAGQPGVEGRRVLLGEPNVRAVRTAPAPSPADRYAACARSISSMARGSSSSTYAAADIPSSGTPEEPVARASSNACRASTGWMGLQNKMADLSTNSVHRVVPGATHASFVENPEHAAAITRAIHDVVMSVRSGAPLNGS
jgi:hypothetical protein